MVEEESVAPSPFVSERLLQIQDVDRLYRRPRESVDDPQPCSI